MSWYCPEKYSKNPPIDVNKELLQLNGDLEEFDAKISLAKFLRSNIGFTTELLAGIKLAPFQEIILKGFLTRNFSMAVLGRGCGKTFLAAVFCFLQTIFEPNTKILIAGPTFRTARGIFNELERIVNSKEAIMLRECFHLPPSKRTDIFEWEINGGIIRAIPLNGEKIRGFRANVLVLDEFLLLSEDIVKNVLMPFLTSPQNLAERIAIREKENDLISDGLLKESERIVFPNTSKMIVLSSASYTFENLYKTYLAWIKNMQTTEEEDKSRILEEAPELVDQEPPKYFIAQLGYDALPDYMMDPTIIYEAKNGGASNSSFLREYGAVFTDGSDSYYSAKKMTECTVENGVYPSTQFIGKRDEKYILAIDPSFSDSPTSDHFAMAVLTIGKQGQLPTLVHNYAVAGGDLKDHHKYLYYLMTRFSPEMIVIDNAGHEFINSAVESSLFKNSRIDIKFMDIDPDLEGIDYLQEIKKARGIYNKQAGCIAVKQFFSSSFLRKSNENLKAMIDYKKIAFASSTNMNMSEFELVASLTNEIPLDYTPFNNLQDLIDFQDDWIAQTKKQCALIEVKTNPNGSQSFDLPSHLKKSKRPDRARKDSYTTLLLAAWGHKIYNDIMSAEMDNITETFTPFLI